MKGPIGPKLVKEGEVPTRRRATVEIVADTLDERGVPIISRLIATQFITNQVEGFVTVFVSDVEGEQERGRLFIPIERIYYIRERLAPREEDRQE